MGNKNRKNPYPRGSAELRADREHRNGRVLKVWRRVDEDDTSLVRGALTELVASGDLPTMRHTTKVDAFIFDPRLMPRNFNAGFVSGYQFGRVLDGIRHAECANDEGYAVKLGRIGLLPNRRTVLAQLDSERLRAERKSIYAIMGASGVKGFTEEGERRHRSSVGTPSIVIGTFEQHVPRVDEEEFLDVITAGVEVSLASANGAVKVGLGPLEIKAYQPNV